MENIIEYFLIMFVVNVILLLIAGFSLSYSLDLHHLKSKNKKLEAINSKFNRTIIEQDREIKKLSDIIEEYRKIVKQ